MTSISPRTGLCAVAWLGLLAALPAGALSAPPEISARLTQVGGVVEIYGSGVRSLPAASAWQVVQEGATVRVPARGFAGLVCSNRRYVRLEGPTGWTLTSKACNSGQLLTEAQYALVAPRAGRFSVISGMMVVDRELRSIRGDNPLAPAVFSLRNGGLPSCRPSLSWLEPQDAEAYLVEWRRDGVTEHRFRLSAAEASCRREPDGLDLCTFPWPAEAPDLAPDTEYVLTVSARNPASPNWIADAPVEIKTPDPADIVRLKTALADLEGLNLVGKASPTAKAGLFASLGHYSEATQAYRQLRAIDPSPEIAITLADLYLVTGFDFLAEPLYREALSTESATVRAASAFGLGRIAYERQLYSEAAGFFEQARKGYAETGMREEAEASERAETLIQKRLADASAGAPHRIGWTGSRRAAIGRRRGCASRWERSINSRKRPAASRIPSVLRRSPSGDRRRSSTDRRTPSSDRRKAFPDRWKPSAERRTV